MVVFGNNNQPLIPHFRYSCDKLQFLSHTKSILINIFKSIPKIYEKYNNRVYVKYTMKPIHLFENGREIQEGDLLIAHIDSVEGHRRVTLTRYANLSDDVQIVELNEK